MENCILHDGSPKKKKKKKKNVKKKGKKKIYFTSRPTLQIPKFPNLTNAPTLADVHLVTRIYGRIYLWPSSSHGESALKKNGRHGRSLNVAATNRISSVADNRRRLNVAPTPPFSIT